METTPSRQANPGSMRAVRFDVSPRGFVVARTLGRFSKSAVFGALSGVRLEERPAPSLLGARWLRLRVLKAGICGSDIGNLTYSSSPAMEPFGSFPAVPGHEILARVEARGAEVRDVEVGQRVVIDPILSCLTRGYDEACPSCASGHHGTCERAGDEAPRTVEGRELAPGLTIGYHRDLPGGWGEVMVAHESQVFPVPEAVDDRVAVLTEPLSIGMHAVLQSRPLGSGPVLVIGSGPIALGTIWALRAAGFEGPILGQAKRPHEARLARRLGANQVVRPGDEARQALVETGASAYQAIVGPEVFSGGGFPLVFDCVGRAGSLDQALRFTAPRGRIVLLGCAGELRKLDLTFLWARDLTMRGFVGYGSEDWQGERTHTFEITMQKMTELHLPLREMVTHVFPLEQYRDALAAAADHRKSGAVKVLLEP